VEAIGGTLRTPPFMLEAHRRYEQDVRSALPPKTFDREFQRGAALSVPSALAYVLQEAPEASPEKIRRADVALTRREWEVADLVAAGISNKEIATKLVIAQRTAENHVERILAKLGFGSRTQIAGWVYEQRNPAAD
jgi:DNA-binding NarL/FixJ family response regulator